MSTDDGRRPIRRALISVYDKTGLVDLAQGLSAAGVEIISTGSTAKTIADTGIPVTPVEQLTGFPEVLDGRVKTLHPRVHAGLLADLRKSEHAAALEQLGIEAFELVVVNLYPFSQTVESGASVDDCVEQIDIGGPGRWCGPPPKTIPARRWSPIRLGTMACLPHCAPADSPSPSAKGWRR
ncbi:bifunctional phosphoribosylaminoimidazolecarboxamide formyltransferase/IMP cyclohydrolase [Mycobacterium tuberculosis CCDC5079]|nr:bifunctional phosphoribosylaminoimidazolecarboxamide formyltransferase/IMP cyclohydrolase [Mycobacterium tuberculosis CCDC5079]